MGTLAFTKENIENSFKVTGIHPTDKNISGQGEFLSLFVTDREEVENEIDHQPAVNQYLLHQETLRKLQK
jgi:hypothetical protein